MQITSNTYAKKMHFTAITPAGAMERTVYIYLVTGKNTSCLIDTGVFHGFDDVMGFIKDSGKTAEEIGEILISHPHVDHIGALKDLKENLNCPAATSSASAEWIENIDEQFKQRPVPNFYDFVKESTEIERTIEGGDIIE